MEEQVIKWLLGELAEDQEKSILDSIEKDPDLAKLVKEYQTIISGLNTLHQENPSQASKFKFTQWLELQSSKDRNPSTLRLRSWIKYGVAASIFLAIGLFIGKEFFGSGNDIDALASAESKDELLHLINTNTTSERIKGINRSYDLRDLDDDVKDVLLKVLNEDESANVRLAAVEALSYFSHQEEIKNVLIDQLKIQKDPIVQIAIINALVDLDDPETVSTFENMMNNQELPKSVQDELAHGMIKIL